MQGGIPTEYLEWMLGTSEPLRRKLLFAAFWPFIVLARS